MHAGPSSRKRSSHKTYVTHLSTNDKACIFCDFSLKDAQVLHAYQHFWLVKNIFPYDIWDDNDVVGHMMIVPKRHVVSLSELRSPESTELFTIIASREKDGYSLYARAPQNIAKSILHQHTHLIKLGKTRKKFKLYLRKPHVLLTK